MTFWGIDSESLEDIKGASVALSAAEMLETSNPSISAAFGTYALQLIENAIVLFGETPEFMDARQKIIQHISGKPVADEKQLDRFGSSIYMAAESSKYQKDLMQLAYLAYACTSIHGPMKAPIIHRMEKAEKGIGGIVVPPSGFAPQPDFNAPPSGYNAPPSGYNAPPSGYNAPPSGYNAPPSAANVPPPAPFNPYSSPEPEQTETKLEKLVIIAKESFRAGAYDIALTAMLAALKELETKV